jgi:hypothetical protein
MCVSAFDAKELATPLTEVINVFRPTGHLSRICNELSDVSIRGTIPDGNQTLLIDIS